MAQFTLEQATKIEQERADYIAGKTGKSATVGFFGSVLNEDGSRTKYMIKNGDVALIRMNYTEIGQIGKSTYHQINHAMQDGQVKNFMKIDCLGKGCPLCAAAKADGDGTGNISKVKWRIFVPMLVAYKKADGTFTTPEAVIWDAPASSKTNTAQTIADLFNDWGALTEHVFKLTRNGTGLDTKYTISYVTPLDNETVLSKDFSAFDNFRIDKHSYWVKTEDEINTFLETGEFPAPATAAEGTTTPVATTTKIPATTANVPDPSAVEDAPFTEAPATSVDDMEGFSF